jgi:hypothetical protein
LKSETMTSYGTTLSLTESGIILEHNRKISKLSQRIEIPYVDLKKVIVKEHRFKSGYAYFLLNHEDESVFRDRDAFMSDMAIVFVQKKKYKEFLPFLDFIESKIASLQNINDSNQEATLIESLAQELLMETKKSLEYKTDQGKLIIKKNTISLTHNRLYVGNKGTKEIAITSISSIHLSKPGIKAGRIRFFIEGSLQETKYQAYLASENELLITTPNDYRTMYEAKEVIESLRLHHSEKLYQALSKHTMTASPADEIRKYKSLLDDGIISEEEFEKKKKELLD